MRQRVKVTGFTLIEMLVALAVFSILSVLAYRALDAILAAEERSAEDMASASEVHQAVAIVLQDLLHLRPRPVRDERGDVQRAYEAGLDDYELRFTRGGLPVVGSITSGMQRIAYSVNDDNELERWVWPALDATSDAEPKTTVLLADVQELTVEQLDRNNQFTELWPPLNETLAFSALPKMMRFTIEFNDGSELVRLIPGLESSSASSAASNNGGNDAS